MCLQQLRSSLPDPVPNVSFTASTTLRELLLLSYIASNGRAIIKYELGRIRTGTPQSVTHITRVVAWSERVNNENRQSEYPAENQACDFPNAEWEC
jgi:hypothetical protein